MTVRNVLGTSGAHDRPMTPRLKSLLIIAAAVSVASGFAGLFAPAQMGAVFGMTLDDVAVSQARLLGASYLGYAVIAWFARDVTDPAAVRAIAVGSAASWAISAVVTATVLTSGLAGSQAWVLVAAEAAFAGAWTVVALRKRAT